MLYIPAIINRLLTLVVESEGFTQQHRHHQHQQTMTIYLYRENRANSSSRQYLGLGCIYIIVATLNGRCYYFAGSAQISMHLNHTHTDLLPSNFQQIYSMYIHVQLYM